MKRIIEGGLAVLVVVLLSCEVGCAPKPPTPQVASTKLAEDIAIDMQTILDAYSEAAKHQMREKFCPKP